MALNILGPVQQGLQIREQRRGRVTEGLQQQLLGEQLAALKQSAPFREQEFQLKQQEQEQRIGLQQQQQKAGALGLQASELGLQSSQIDARNKELTSIAQGAEGALELTGTDRQTFLNNRLEEINKRGGNSEATQEVLQLAEQFGIDSPEVNAALNEGLSIANSFGILTPKQVAAQQAEALKLEQTFEQTKIIRKEVRGRVGTAVKDLSKEASIVTENFGKLNGLVELIKGGNRSAVAQALIAVVKLGDPGSVVKEEEMKAVLNAPNPLAALANIGGDTSAIESIVRKIDPLNPTAINTDELLGTANALIATNIPSLQARFAEQRQLAESNLTEAGVKSLFPEAIGGRIKDLSDLIKAQPGAKFKSGALGKTVTEQQIQDTLSDPENAGLTREDLFKQLGIK